LLLEPSPRSVSSGDGRQASFNRERDIPLLNRGIGQIEQQILLAADALQVVQQLKLEVVSGRLHGGQVAVTLLSAGQ
jgi:hypothetical protein